MYIYNKVRVVDFINMSAYQNLNEDSSFMVFNI
jgi:hypothetical protein